MRSAVPGANSPAEPEAVIAAIREQRVGGTYWGIQPALPEPGYAVIKTRDRSAPHPPAETEVLRWPSGEVDPWPILAGANEVIVEADDELALLGAIAGTSVRCIGEGKFAGVATKSGLIDAVQSTLIDGANYADPFTGEPIDVLQAIELCGFWRRLIDSNRSIAGAFGFATWKRQTVAAFLWGGTGTSIFRRSPADLSDQCEAAIWRTRAGERTLRALEARDLRLTEIEDGFIRSAGLGADCVPPLSIVVDRVGAYFDPTRPSELEQLIESGNFSPNTLNRAAALRRLIVDSGISKYERGSSSAELSPDSRRQILVPGQVEDDRAVLLGGQGLTSNLELLKRVRCDSPDAKIVYKPHPDVEAGHRRGAIDDDKCLAVADDIVRNQPISGLIDAVDEVHVNTSLAGFEALLRGKPVTTHGMPFYAGWGLTRDLGSVPDRRKARRTLDELVAAALLVYPRYLDPVTGLPCPPEVLIRRLSEQSVAPRSSTLVTLRRLQGRLQQKVRAFSARVTK